MNALIGHTGFVGSNILAQENFDKCYNSKNIESIRGESFDLIVCAGVSSVKWKANKEPERDFGQIKRLIYNLDNVGFKRLILISTIAVYDNPADNIYGRHRLYLETYLYNNYNNVSIMRLPSLFGNGLKKNPIYDLVNSDYRFLPHSDSKFQYYNLNNIWKDIKLMMDKEIDILNISTEPVRFGEVLGLFNVEINNLDSRKIVNENMVTNYANDWGKDTPYLYSRDEVLTDLKEFIKNYE